MDIPALIPLAKIDDYPQVKVGKQIKQLFKLQLKNLPVAKTAIIPSTTLEKIAQHSHLAQSLRQIIDTTIKHEKNQAILLRKLQNAIRKVVLPTNIINEVLAWYHQNPSFVKVFADDFNHPHSQENVIGDANLIDSILLIWSQQIQLDFQHRQVKLFAQSIIIQHQGEPISAGIAFTQSPTSRSNLQILSVWGVFDHNFLEIEPDQFEIDLRTKQIVHRHLYPQYLQLQRRTDQLQEKAILHYKQNQLSLENNQVLTLAHSVITAKRLFLGDHQLSWFYQDDQFFITSITPTQPTAITTDKLGKTLLIGDSLHPGVTSGTIFKLTHKNQINQLDHGQIVVMNQFKPDYLPILSKAAAIICDRGLDSPTISKRITQHALPTIINTKHATKYLKSGLTVIVNANSGRVLAIAHQQTHSSTPVQPTVIKTYISAGNPHKAQQYITDHVDGVGVLRSEYTFASLGEHPKYLLNSKKRQLLKNTLKNTIQSYRHAKKNLPLIYRTLDLTSQEFKALAFAHGFEPDESNPYLGYRGGLRTLNNFDLLDLEVEVLQDIAIESNIPLGLMLPFIRTSSEFQLIKNYLARKHHFSPGSKIELWLQLNTPENILQIDYYLSSYLAGLSLNARSIHALAHGIDPDNPDIFSLYPYDINLMEKLLTIVIEAVKTKNSHYENMHAPTKVMIHIEDNNLRLVEIATKLGYDIITVKPDFAPRTKQRIREIETQQLTQI